MNQRLTAADVGSILSALKCGVSQSEIAARFCISQSHVSRLKNRNRRAMTIRQINRKYGGVMTFKRAE